MSEFVQAILPTKTFQYGDILANIVGTTLGSAVAGYMQTSRLETASNHILLDNNARLFHEEEA